MFVSYKASNNLQLADKRLDALRRQKRNNYLDQISVLDETRALKRIDELVISTHQA